MARRSTLRPERSSETRMRVLSRLGRWLVVAAVGLAGGWVGLSLLGVDRQTLGPFTVALQTRPGYPATVFALPPLGRIEASTHRSPLKLSVTLRAIDPDELQAALRGSSIEEVTARLQRDVPGIVRSHALRSFGAVGAGALALSILVFRKRWRRVVAATAVSGGTFLALALLALASYRPAAFLEPTFHGSLQLAPPLIGSLEAAGTRIDEFREALERLVGTATHAYSVVTNTQPASGATVILHVTDLHSSQLGIDFVQNVATSFDVDAVVDTGDLTAFGTPLEAAVLSQIRNLGRPYVFVRGNHDTAAVDRAIERLPEGVVLDNEETTIEGVRIYGAPHPVERASEGTIPDQEFASRVSEAGRDLADRIGTLSEPPQILLVHDDRMAEASAGLVPLVLSGHFHHHGERELGGTIYLRGGAASGGGLLEPFSPQDVNLLSVEVIYIEEGRLVAYDTIQFDVVAEEVTVRRHLVAALPETSPTPAAADSARSSFSPQRSP